jgi:hypothetical protein
MILFVRQYLRSRTKKWQLTREVLRRKPILHVSGIAACFLTLLLADPVANMLVSRQTHPRMHFVAGRVVAGAVFWVIWFFVIAPLVKQEISKPKDSTPK